ncbi:MAG TPA: glycine cleavage T C-terminal barrel domain-containing protein [Thermoanaerobaculia bacterium]
MIGPPFLFDLGARGAIVLTGKDRASFLHGLVTNDTRKLTPGTGCAAAFLTPKGKMLADGVVLCEEDRLEIDCGPELAGKIETLLRKYLVFNDVQIVDETPAHAVFHLTGEAAGDAAEDLLRKVMGPGLGAAEALPQGPHAHRGLQFPFKENPPLPEASKPAGDDSGAPIRIVRENRTGVPGWDVRLPSSLSEEIQKNLVNGGARQATLDRLDALRIAAGIPRWGFELTETVLPDEAGLRERGFISESKGCYIGQETVARIKTYGHVNRRLVLLSVSGGVPARENEIFFESEKSGAVTSAAPGGAPGEAVALAYVKSAHANPGARLLIRTPEGDLPASVGSAP